MKNIKIVSLVIIVVLLSGCFQGCSGEKAKKVSMYDLKTAMEKVTDKFSDMTYASSEDSNPEEIFENISGMDYSKVDSFFILYATNGTGNSDEIAVIQVKNNSDVTLARQELEAHLQKRTALYSTYDKSQLTKLNAGKIEVEGNCVALIVCDDVQAVSKEFHSFINAS
jgi:hypothetical protein